MTSQEFTEWQWAESQGELPDQWQLFGTVAASSMNSGYRHPKEWIGWEHFKPKIAEDIDPNSVVEKLVDRREVDVPPPNDLAWQT